MLPEIRRKNTSVVERLLSNPEEFSFVQIVRLLENSLVSGAPHDLDQSLVSGSTGGFTAPTKEIIEFFTKPSLRFPEHQVTRIDLRRQTDFQVKIKVQVNFIGILGSMGVMPYHYTEFLLQRQKQKDETLAHFIDLFNHRLASLFYRSQIKYSIPIAYEKNALIKDPSSHHGKVDHTLLSLIGLGTGKLQQRALIQDQSLIYYSGLLTQKNRSSIGLKLILKDYFEVPVEIDEFVGQWKELIPDIRTQIASKQFPLGQNACLGKSAMLGSKAWIGQGKIKIIIGPLSKQQLSSFAPGTKTFSAMNSLVKIYLGDEHDYEFIMKINRNDLPQRIQLNTNKPPILGWSSWLQSSALQQNTSSNDIVQVRVSAKQIH